MILKGETLREQAQGLKRHFPRKTAYGFLYKKKADLKEKRYVCMVVMVWQNEDGIYRIHQTKCVAKKEGRNAEEWRAWLDRVFFKGSGHASEGTAVDRLGILKGNVIPQVNYHENHDWELTTTLGFYTSELSKPENEWLEQKRRKYKSTKKGKANG